MRAPRIFIVLLTILIYFTGNKLLRGEIAGSDHTGEKILYSISPVGKAEYHDLGLVDLKGIKLNLVVFKTKALVLEDTEKIYSDPASSLPYRIERSISKLWSKEYITEEYDQKEFKVVIRKYKGSKLMNEQTFKASGPIQNAILLPFSLRRVAALEIGQQFTVRLPDEFQLKLVSIDDIKVPAGKFRAYHFKSTPDKFEIWINFSDPRVPLKIQGKGVFNYSLLMKKYFRPEVKP